jgi:hypothetical protein
MPFAILQKARYYLAKNEHNKKAEAFHEINSQKSSAKKAVQHICPGVLHSLVCIIDHFAKEINLDFYFYAFKKTISAAV